MIVGSNITWRDMKSATMSLNCFDDVSTSDHIGYAGPRGVELIAAEDVLDTVDAHEDRVARIRRVAETGFEMRRDR